jgi:hypothetical protein
MNFPQLKALSNTLEQDINSIATKWVENEAVGRRLKKYGIDSVFFLDHFGANVVGYLLGLIRGVYRVEECNAIHVLLTFCEEKNIPSEDLFILYAGFKNIFISLLTKKDINNPEAIQEFASLSDAIAAQLNIQTNFSKKPTVFWHAGF